jgi:hypothetical protein
MKGSNLFLIPMIMVTKAQLGGFFHECEIKYKIDGKNELERIVKLLEQKKFTYVSLNKETDFVPDVEGFLCRKNSTLLRFREIKGKHLHDILVTMKVKGSSQSFQEFYELEYSFQKYDNEIFQKISKYIHEITGIKIPQAIHSLTSFNDLVELIRNIGFNEHRIWLEKLRRKYNRRNEVVTIDLLPEGIGYYLEVETDSELKLNNLIKEFNLETDLLETMDYGDILKKHKKGQEEKEQRTGLFNQKPIYDD